MHVVPRVELAVLGIELSLHRAEKIGGVVDGRAHGLDLSLLDLEGRLEALVVRQLGLVLPKLVHVRGQR